jgi:hypothetical protein
MGTYWESDPERVRWHLSEAKRLRATKKARSPVAWLRAGLKNDYRPQRSLDWSGAKGKEAREAEAAELAAEKKKREEGARRVTREGEKEPVKLDATLQEALLRLGDRIAERKLKDTERR